MILSNQFSELMDLLSTKQRRYIHFKSIRNFINHLNEFDLITDKQICENKLTEYLELIQENITTINGNFATELYINFLFPLGNIYKKIGFIKIIPVKNLIAYSIMIDILMAILFWKIPYPILTILVLIDFYFRKNKYYKAGKVFGMFY